MDTIFAGVLQFFLDMGNLNEYYYYYYTHDNMPTCTTKTIFLIYVYLHFVPNFTYDDHTFLQTVVLISVHKSIVTIATSPESVL